MIVSIVVIISRRRFLFYVVASSEKQIFQTLENTGAGPFLGLAVVVVVGDDEDPSWEDGHEDCHHDGEQHERRHEVHDRSDFRCR